MLRDGQFTLRSLFVATALIALACAAVRYVVTTGGSTGQVLGALLVPILICGAVGVIFGRVKAGLSIGIAIAFALLWMVLCLMQLGAIDDGWPNSGQPPPSTRSLR
jgi:hypothetical protein